MGRCSQAGDYAGPLMAGRRKINGTFSADLFANHRAADLVELSKVFYHNFFLIIQAFDLYRLSNGQT
jgi:hypothetical protein